MRFALDLQGFCMRVVSYSTSHGRLKLIQREKSVKNWFKSLIAYFTGTETDLVLLQLTFDFEPLADSPDGIPKLSQADDLDRRLAEAWAKSEFKPDLASGLEAKRKAPQPLPPELSAPCSICGIRHSPCSNCF